MPHHTKQSVADQLMRLQALAPVLPERVLSVVGECLDLAITQSNDTLDYSRLVSTTIECLRQATAGKGRERHARGRGFDEQPIIVIPTLLGGRLGLGGLLYQAIKKIEEATGMEQPRMIAELRGAVVYTLAAIMYTTDYDCSPATALLVRPPAQVDTSTIRVTASTRDQHTGNSMSAEPCTCAAAFPDPRYCPVHRDPEDTSNE